MTQVIAESVVASSDSILGNATLTTEESMNAMLDPSTQAINTQLFCRFGQGAAVAVERISSSSQGRAFRVVTGFVPFAATPTSEYIRRAFWGRDAESAVCRRRGALRSGRHARDARAAATLSLGASQHLVYPAVADDVCQQHVY